MTITWFSAVKKTEAGQIGGRSPNVFNLNCANEMTCRDRPFGIYGYGITNSKKWNRLFRFIIIRIWITDLSAATSAREILMRRIIDTDVHEGFASIKDLVPYLAEPYRSWIANGSWRGFSQPFAYTSPGNGNRADVRSGDGSASASDYASMKRQLLDPYNVTYAILTGYFYPTGLKLQYGLATALAAAYNDYVVEHWLSKDRRFLGSIQINARDPDQAAREIDRMGKHPQMKQVMLAVVDDIAYGHPMYRPIFAAAERNDLMIAFHHTTFAQGPYGMGLHYMERHALIPIALMPQVISLIVNGVFDGFPKLRFMVLEGGFSWLPHVMWRLDREYRQGRVEVPWLKKLPSQHCRERLRLSTQPTEDISTGAWLKLVELMGTDEILVFSTDYPHFDFDSPDASVPSGLPEGLREKIFWKNAADFYGLESPQAAGGRVRDNVVAE